MTDPTEQLTRTIDLLQLDIFPGLPREQISEALLSFRVRIRADATTCNSTAGRAAVISACCLIAEMGMQVSLELADVEIGLKHPPLAPGLLHESLAGAFNGRIGPVRTVASGPVDLTFSLGDMDLLRSNDALVGVAGDSFAWELKPGTSADCGWVGEMPFGGVGAGIACAAEALRAAMSRLAEATGVDPLAEHRIGPAQAIKLALPVIPSPVLDLGPVDVISGGAITNSFLFSMLQVPGLTASMRVFDDDVVELSNSNRTPMFQPHHLALPKADALASWGTERVTIAAITKRFSDALPADERTLADTVVVGVDDIPARWLVQSHAPAWVCVGATSHFEVQVSEHIPGRPCAGCSHPRDEPDDGPIPTISFVSAMAGLLQAYMVVAHASGVPCGQPWLAYPFAFGGTRTLRQVGIAHHPACPLRCTDR